MDARGPATRNEQRLQRLRRAYVQCALDGLRAHQRIKKTGDDYPLACTQYHFSMEGRQILATGTLAEYHKNPNFANELAQLPPKELSLYKGEAEYPTTATNGRWLLI